MTQQLSSQQPKLRQGLETKLGFPLPPEIHQFTPIGNRILVRRSEREEKTESGLHIPDNAQQPSSDGVVVKVGHLVGTANQDLGWASVPEGDLVGKHVVFGQFSGSAIKFHAWDDTYGGEFLLMQVRDIWGFNTQKGKV